MGMMGTTVSCGAVDVSAIATVDVVTSIARVPITWLPCCTYRSSYLPGLAGARSVATVRPVLSGRPFLASMYEP